MIVHFPQTMQRNPPSSVLRWNVTEFDDAKIKDETRQEKAKEF